MAVLHNESFFLAGWLVQPALNRMEQGMTTVQVEPKVMQVLTVLAGQAGEPVTRETLFDTVWTGTVVTDDTLTRCVSELRKLFDDDARQPHIIETIPRVGYRLVAPVLLNHRGDSFSTASPICEIAPSQPLPAPRRRRRVPVWTWSAAGVLLAGLGILLGWQVVHPAAPSSIVQPVRTVPLTSLPGRERSAALSPGGNRVAFVWNGRESEAQADLYASTFPVEQPLRLTDHPAPERSPAWSPDGQSLAFIRSTPDDCGVFIVPALGGPERRLASCHPASYASLDWSPDGRWLALSDKDAPYGRYTLRLLSAETGERRDLEYATESSWGDFMPRFAPDGSALLFMRSLGEGQRDLFVLSLQDASLQRVTFDATGLAGHTWTPDGRQLIFSSNRSGLFSLWRVRADGGTPEWLAVHDEAFSPAMAAGLLVYERQMVESNLYLASAEGVPQMICSSSHTDSNPQFAPDGKQIAFISTRSGEQAVWVCNADKGMPVQATFHQNTSVFGQRWSPDGVRLAYTAFDEGQANVYVVDRLGDPPRRLTEAASNEVYPSWSPDGRWIYFGSDRSGRMEVWKQPAGGGEAVQVTHDGGFIALATDATLYFTREGRSGLWQMPIAGGAATSVLEDFDLATAVTWTMHPDGFYFLNRSDPSHIQVMKYDFASQMPHLAHDLGAAFVVGSLAVSPDGQRFLYSQAERQEGDLMRVANLSQAITR